MRFLQSRSRRCCLLKWVQMGLKRCVQAAEASIILAIRLDFLQVLCRQCTYNSTLLSISTMHDYSQRDCRSRPVRRWRGLARRPGRQSHCCARQQRSGHRCLCCQRWMVRKDLQMLCSPGQRLALTGCKSAPYVNSAFSYCIPSDMWRLIALLACSMHSLWAGTQLHRHVLDCTTLTGNRLAGVVWLVLR